MIPPLPAPSRPSKTMHTLRPFSLIHSCALTSSTWSFARRFSYSLRVSFSRFALPAPPSNALSRAAIGPPVSRLSGRGRLRRAEERLDRGVHGRKERTLPEVLAEADARDLLAERSVGAGELELDPLGMELGGEPRQHLRSRDVDLGHRLHVDQQP